MTVIAGNYVAAYANSAGFIGNDLRIAVAVAKAESGWDTQSRYVTSQEDSRGLWQINTYAHPNFNGNSLYDPTYNANAARTVWRNAGNRWTPWTTYTRGTYLQYLDDADAALRRFTSLGGEAGVSSSAGVGIPAGAEGPVSPQPWGPWDFSNHIYYIADRFNEVGGFLQRVAQMCRDINNAGEPPVRPQ